MDFINPTIKDCEKNLMNLIEGGDSTWKELQDLADHPNLFNAHEYEGADGVGVKSITIQAVKVKGIQMDTLEFAITMRFKHKDYIYVSNGDLAFSPRLHEDNYKKAAKNILKKHSV